MKTDTYPRSFATNNSITGTIAAFPGGKLAALRKYRKYRRTVEALSACTDRVLEDNGMTRADIHCIAQRDSMGND